MVDILCSNRLDGRILFFHFRIPGKSIDEGLAPLMFDEDVLSLLKYVSRYREIEEDDVENITEASTSKVTPLGKGSNESIYGLSDSDSTNHTKFLKGLERGCLARGGLKFETHLGLLPLQAEYEEVPIEKAEHGIEEPVQHESDGINNFTRTMSLLYPNGIVSSDDIVDMARATGCTSGTIPFIYLGLPIGSNMNLIANWQSLIDRFHESILKNLESIRASFFWGGSGDRKKMVWPSDAMLEPADAMLQPAEVIC
ncbi:hypothetical protein Tco_0799204 [Tanacetum coccineum]